MVRVRSYKRKDGTRVTSHKRSFPEGSSVSDAVASRRASVNNSIGWVRSVRGDSIIWDFKEGGVNTGDKVLLSPFEFSAVDKWQVHAFRRGGDHSPIQGFFKTKSDALSFAKKYMDSFGKRSTSLAVPRGWKKEFVSKKSSRLVRWRNTNNSDNIEVYREKFNEQDGYKWFIDVITKGAIKSAEYDTKTEATERAMKYMRSHPNG